jgi:hypothetical protein
LVWLVWFAAAVVLLLAVGSCFLPGSCGFEGCSLFDLSDEFEGLGEGLVALGGAAGG